MVNIRDVKADEASPLGEQAEEAKSLRIEEAVALLCRRSFKNAKMHGFWDGQLRKDSNEAHAEVLKTIPEKIALIHSEASEMLECYRGGPGEMAARFGPTGKPEGFLAEAADVLIRIGDLIGAMGLSDEFAHVLEEKHKYNKSRPYKHGKTC